MNTSSNNTILDSVNHLATMGDDGRNTNFDITCIELCLRDFLANKGYHETVYCQIYFQLLHCDEDGPDGKPDFRARGGMAMSVPIANAHHNTWGAAKNAAVAMIQRIAEEAPHYRLLVPLEFKWSEHEHDVDED